MKVAISLILLTWITPFKLIGQTDSGAVSPMRFQYHMKKNITLITGYQIQKNHFAEVGLGIIKDGVMGHHPSTIIYGLSNELKISNDFIWGPKAVLWMGGGVSGMNLGLNLINYTNFRANSLQFRPEIGIGFSVFRIVYGYNLSITNDKFEGINKHNFGLNIMFKLKALKEEHSWIK